MRNTICPQYIPNNFTFVKATNNQNCVFQNSNQTRAINTANLKCIKQNCIELWHLIIKAIIHTSNTSN